MANNRIVIIDNVADLPAASGGVRTLAADTTYQFNQGTFTLSDRLVLSAGSQIMGNGKTQTILDYTGVGNFITTTNTNNLIRDVELKSTTGGTLFNISNASSNSLYVEDCNFRSFASLGTIAGGGIFFRYVLALSCVNGLLISGALGSVVIDTSSFRALSGGANSYGLKVATGSTSTSFRSLNSIFEVAATHYGLWIEGTFTLTSGALLNSNVFYGAGTNYLSGVNPLTTGWLFNNNTNIPNRVGSFNISTLGSVISGNGSPTVESVANDRLGRVLTQTSGTNLTASYLSEFSIPLDFFSFFTNCVSLDTKRNTVNANVTATMGKGGVVDATMNAVNLSATGTGNVYETKRTQPTSSYSPGDRVVTSLNMATNANGASCGISAFRISYFAK